MSKITLLIEIINSMPVYIVTICHNKLKYPPGNPIHLNIQMMNFAQWK